jgi:hypothetical protein
VDEKMSFLHLAATLSRFPLLFVTEYFFDSAYICFFFLLIDEIGSYLGMPIYTV